MFGEYKITVVETDYSHKTDKHKGLFISILTEWLGSEPYITTVFHTASILAFLCILIGKVFFRFIVFHTYRCRTLQHPFDACIKEHLNQDRPELDHFTRVRLHKTTRPRPEYGLAPMPERIPDLPDFSDLPEPERIRERRTINDWFIWFTGGRIHLENNTLIMI